MFLTHVCSLRLSVPYACLFLTHVCSLRMSVLSNVCFQWRKTFTWSLVTTVTLNLTVSIFLCSDIPWQAEWITAKVSLPNELFLIFIWKEWRSFEFSTIILLNALQNLYMIKRYWTTFETLAEIERGCKERQLCMGDWNVSCDNISSKSLESSVDIRELPRTTLVVIYLYN